MSPRRAPHHPHPYNPNYNPNKYDLRHFDPELRSITLNPTPTNHNPKIDIILAIDCTPNSHTTSTTLPTLLQFCQNFNFTLLHLPTILHALLTTPFPNEVERAKAFGPLHPLSLRHRLERGGRVSVFFLLPILKWRIEEEVWKFGQSNFVLAGLEEVVGADQGVYDLVNGVMGEIAHPAAVISFHQHGRTVMSRAHFTLESYFRDILVRVWKCDEDGSKVYLALLAAVYEKAAKPGCADAFAAASSRASSVTLQGESEGSAGSSVTLSGW